MPRALYTALILLTFVFTLAASSLSATEVPAPAPETSQAIEDYNSKDYGAALLKLLALRESGSQSALGAYYIGLSYKELLIYDKAVLFLKEAAWHKTPISDAFYSLAEIYFDLGRPYDALGQIENAEEAGVRPAYTAYLKGLILMSQGKPFAAITVFDRAKLLDSGLGSAVEYQKNVAFQMIAATPK